MRTHLPRFAVLSGTILSFGACSLINSYDDVIPEEEIESTGGLGGLGGMTNVGTGGKQEPTGGNEGTGGEPAIEPLAPGLVVVGADDDNNIGTIDDHFIIALDPRTGMELTRTELGAYEALAYEANRDVWFFVRDAKLQAAKFNRISREFEMIGDEVEAVTAPDPNRVFALTDSFVIMDGEQVLNVYDTTDLEDIKPATVPEIPLPTSEAVPGETRTLWDVRSVASSTGGNIYVLWNQCSSLVDDCGVRLSRIQPSSPSAMPPTVTVEDLSGVDEDLIPTRSVLGFDELAGFVLAYVPDHDGVAPAAGNLYRFNGSLTPQSSLLLKQNGPNQAFLEVDSCSSVAFMKDLTAAPLVAAGLQAGAPQIDVSVGINGQGMVFEPYTSSLVMLQSTTDNPGVTAWESRGTIDEPAMAKRLGTWRPPTLSPFVVRVEAPQLPVCE